jgi:acyl carrier protein
MTRGELVTNIEKLLQGKAHVRPVPRLQDETRLNEDLGLDSVMLLELLVRLELDLRISIPEEAPAKEHFVTVGGLADFLLGLRRTGERNGHEV